MIDLDVSIGGDIKRAARRLNKTERTALPLAASRALNRTRDNARTRLIRGLTTHIGLPNQKTIRRRYLRRFSFNARRNRIEAALTMGTFEMAIGNFFPADDSSIGAQIHTKRATYVFPQGFVQTMPASGHTNVYERFGPKTRVVSQKTGRARRAQRIRKVTIDITRPVRVIGTRSVLLARREVWPKRFEYELRRELRKIWKR